MKINEYITAEDWNALGAEKQLSLKSSLRFMGYRVSDECLPLSTVRGDYIIELYEDGDLAISRRASFTNRISLEEVLSFIELTSFGVRE